MKLNKNKEDETDDLGFISINDRLRRRTLLKGASTIWGLGAIGRASAHSDTRFQSETSETSSRLLPDLEIINNSEETKTINAIVLGKQTTDSENAREILLDREVVLKSGDKESFTVVFAGNESYPVQNDYELKAHDDNGNSVTQDIAVVAALPLRYGAVIDATSSGTLLAYDAHIDPGPAFHEEVA